MDNPSPLPPAPPTHTHTIIYTARKFEMHIYIYIYMKEKKKERKKSVWYFKNQEQLEKRKYVWNHMTTTIITTSTTIIPNIWCLPSVRDLAAVKCCLIPVCVPPPPPQSWCSYCLIIFLGLVHSYVSWRFVFCLSKYFFLSLCFSLCVTVSVSVSLPPFIF